jgi:signal peptidase I
MHIDKPDPSPRTSRVALSRRSKLLIALGLIPALAVAALVVLRICGLVRPFSAPTGAMALAISPGDHVMMEGLTFLFREPRRGDIIVFKMDGIAPLPPGTMYVKRVAGEPGEHLQISGGKLFVNDKHVSLSNSAGEIVYNLPRRADAFLFPQTNVTVFGGWYFVLGDNSTNSFDSRFWGSVPRSNILGRVSFCYWPPHRVGKVK